MMEPGPVLPGDSNATKRLKLEAEAERRRFDAELLAYYATHNAEAEQLARYIFALTAALKCAQLSDNATPVGFSFPVLPGVAAGGRIKEAEVLLQN
jgi:hypothetical protein